MLLHMEVPFLMLITKKSPPQAEVVQDALKPGTTAAVLPACCVLGHAL